MIAAVSGALRAVGEDWVQVDIGGVTLQVSAPTRVAAGAEIGDVITLHTRLMIRDDEPQLYGFSTPQHLRFFSLLIGVSGIGPRSALSLLSARSPQELANAILAGDLATLTTAPGVGKRTAARIALDLKGVIEAEGLGRAEDVGPPPDDDALAALTSLGYTAGEARRALAEVSAEIAGLELEEQVRRALAHLAG